MKYKAIPKYELSDIDEVFLLSAEEWERVKEIEAVPKNTGWWLLRSSGNYSGCAAFVDRRGFVRGLGCSVNFDNGARPALKMQNLRSEIGDKVLVNNTLCTAIEPNAVLSDSVICLHRFDPCTNDYEKSEIKAFINSDEFKGML